jgi:hypothetical protein
MSISARKTEIKNRRKSLASDSVNKDLLNEHSNDFPDLHHSESGHSSAEASF